MDECCKMFIAYNAMNYKELAINKRLIYKMNGEMDAGRKLTYYEPVMYCFTKYKKAPRKHQVTYFFYLNLINTFKSINLNPRELFHLLESLQMLSEYSGEVHTYQVR
jgi:hypothetical protein